MSNPYTTPALLLPAEATATDGIRAWIDIENTCEAFVRAGLRKEIGADSDIEEAYRKWYERDAEEKSKAFVTMCENFSRRHKAHG